jgi:hypothetical protein
MVSPLNFPCPDHLALLPVGGDDINFFKNDIKHGTQTVAPSVNGDNATKGAAARGRRSAIPPGALAYRRRELPEETLRKRAPLCAGHTARLPAATSDGSTEIAVSIIVFRQVIAPPSNELRHQGSAVICSTSARTPFRAADSPSTSGMSGKPSKKNGTCTPSDFAQVLQPAGADAVRTLLVLLNLLKCQPNRFCDFFLAHIEREARRSQRQPCRPTMSLGWRSALLRHHSLPPKVLEPIRRQCRVYGGAGDRPVAKPALDRPGVVALDGESLDRR